MLDLNRTLGTPSNTAFTNTTKRTFNYNEYVVGMTTNNYYANDNKSSSISNNQVKYTSNDANYGIAFPVKVEASTEYTFTADTNKGNSNYVRAIFYQSDGTYISDVRSSGTANYLTFTTPSNCDFVLCSLYANANEETTYSNIQLEKGSSSSPYRPYATPIELNAIGNYKDGFARNTGKNLLSVPFSQMSTTSIYTEIDNFPSGTFTFSFENDVLTPAQTQVKIKNSNNQWEQLASVGNAKQITFTLDKKQIIRIECYKANSNPLENYYNMMINEGSTPLPYEPYGTGLLCKYNAIKKIVWDGSENWSYSTSGGYPRCGSGTIPDLKAYTDTQRHIGYFICSHFTPNTNDGTGHMYQYQTGILCNPTSDITSANDFKTWLSSHNTEFMYVLSTPYLTLIEDETLIEQYNALENALSEKGQTNILQNNNDLPFYLIASAMKQNSNEVIVNNIGNIYAKPTLDIEGSGIINIYKDNNQILQLNMDDTNEIVFEDMNAFDPATNELKNRKVTGNYNNVTIPSGESIIKADGNLTKMTITNYTRWL